MLKGRATTIGFSAILMWAALALLTIYSAPVPPLLLNTICFAIGGTLGLIWCLTTGRLALLRTVPLKVYAFGTAGLFGYHLLYFSAFRLAPYAETGLIAYLWPLLIVLMSGLLPGERLRPLHVIGAMTGFCGSALILLNSGAGFAPERLPGFALAFLCALTWSGYSVLSRKLGQVPSESVTVFCLATAGLSFAAHLMFEVTEWPATSQAWLAVIGLGIGPVGLAFFFWDLGMKQGDIQLLGTASYAAPLLSTLALVFFGVAELTTTIILASLLITAGAALAAIAGRRPRRDQD
ncbi:MAG: EamA family transporter [Paracoccaceae bacterium]